MAPKDRNSSSEDGPVAQSPAALEPPGKLVQSPGKLVVGHVQSGDSDAGRRTDGTHERPNFLISHSFHEVRTYTVEKSASMKESIRCQSWNGKTGLHNNGSFPAASSSPMRRFTGTIGATASQMICDDSATISDPLEPEDCSKKPETINVENRAASHTPNDVACANQKVVHYSPGILWLAKGSKLIVAGFQAGSQAKEMGVRPGDILRRVDGEDYLRTQQMCAWRASVRFKRVTKSEVGVLTMDLDNSQPEQVHPGEAKLLGESLSACSIAFLRVKAKADGSAGFREFVVHLPRCCSTVRSHFNIGLPGVTLSQ